MTLITSSALGRHFENALSMACGPGHAVRPQQVDSVSTLIVLKFLSDARGSVGKVRFEIPKESTWRAIASSPNCSDAIEYAAGQLEDANPSLEGVLSTPERERPRRTMDLGENINLLRVIQHLEQVPLRPDEHESRFALGLAHETMLRVGLTQRPTEASDHVTPPDANTLLSGLAAPGAGATVNDPAAGLGATLTELLRQNERLEPPLVISAQEVEFFTWRLCRRNLLLHGQPTARVTLCDTLLQPPLAPDGRLQTYDIVVADPPWTIRSYNVGAGQEDPWGRFPDRLPRTRPEFAWIYHAMATLRPDGRAVLLLSQGALFRGGEEKHARKRIVETDAIEGIVALPNTRQSTSIPYCALFINKSKRPERRGRVIFIDAATEPRDETERAIGADSFALALSLARKFEDYPGRAAIVSARDIEGQDFNLAVTKYVRRERSRTEFDVENALLRIRDFERQREMAERAMDEALRQVREKKEAGG